MISGDYKERERRTRSGKTVTDRIVVSRTGTEYMIGPELGRGGVAAVFRARRCSDQKEFAFKEFEPSPENRRVHRCIKKNIEDLIRRPLTDDDGKSFLESFIRPLDLVDLPASGGFGYIMELVDTDKYIQVIKLRHDDVFPEADILCKACINIAHFFKRVHFRGVCYKDISYNNVFINPRTGDVRIIDCDNISVQSVKTIFGTEGFAAPEIYVTETPDTYSDYFSMACLFYFILVGGNPLDGKKTRDYLMKNNLDIHDARAVIYGSDALFAFDPRDHSNEIRNLKDPLTPYRYEAQVICWENLPPAVKQGFIQTFSTGLKNENKHMRVKDTDWIRIFEGAAASDLVRCSCGKMNFGDRAKHRTCIFCGKKIPLIKDRPKPAPVTAPVQGPVPNELTSVTFLARRDIAPTRLNITAKRKALMAGRQVYPGLNEGWMKIQYNSRVNSLAAVNMSGSDWIVTDNGIKKNCGPGGRVILKKGMIITVFRRRLQLTVEDIR